MKVRYSENTETGAQWLRTFSSPPLFLTVKTTSEGSGSTDNMHIMHLSDGTISGESC